MSFLGFEMEYGYVKIWRKLLQSPIFLDPNANHLFIYLLLEAQWTEGKSVYFKGKQVVLKPGQLTMGRHEVARKTGLTASTVRNCLKRLRDKYAILDYEADSKWTMVTIMKWGLYQKDISKEDRLEDNERTASGHSLRRKEGKKIKEFNISADADSSKSVSLKDIKSDLSEGSKHRLYNDLVDTFKNRGWRTEADFLKPIFRDLSKQVSDKNPREVFPYFKKALHNWINQNAEWISKHKIEVPIMDLTKDLIKNMV